MRLHNCDILYDNVQQKHNENLKNALLSENKTI